MSYSENIDINNISSGVFGETITAHKTPIVQIANKYQIDPSNLDEFEVFEATGGTADNNGNLFRCQSGTSVGGYGVIRSKETLNYRAGQGIEALFTASFTTGIANSLQFGGLFSLTDTVAFGYDGANFSCLHSYGGVAEVQVLEVTVTGAGTCTVTLDSDSVGISVTNSDIVTNANELRVGLEGDATLNGKWRFEQVASKVYCISKTVGDKTGTMSISGGVTATITEATAGADKTDGHITQASWNITTSPFASFDPTKINVYKIQIGYLGVANITYSIYNPDTREFVKVHSIKWSGAYNVTHVINPNFKIGWTSASLGSSGTNLTVTGASGAIMLEGDEIIKNNTFAYFNTKSSIGTTLTNILTIKNRVVYGDRFNLGKLFPLRVSVDNDHTKGSIIEILRNADVAGTLDYEFEDEFNSIALTEINGTTVTNGTLIDAIVVEKGATADIDLTILKSEVLPEDTITIAVRTISGTGATITASTTWKEEK
jgi:hypothetical protein